MYFASLFTKSTEISINISSRKISNSPLSNNGSGEPLKLRKVNRSYLNLYSNSFMGL